VRNISENWEKTMASGEGTISASEWPKLVLDGKFTPVVKGMQKVAFFYNLSSKLGV
jgi:hypothetical protein